MDELISKIKIEGDLKKRDGYIRDAMKLNSAEVGILPIHQPVVPWAMRKNVDAVFAPNNIAYFSRYKLN